MRVIIRADSSFSIGSGHIMRCLTLAGQLKKENSAEVHFICRDLDGNLSNLVRDAGCHLHLLPRAEYNPALKNYESWLTVTQEQDASESKALLSDLRLRVDRIVVDSYAIDETWEKLMRPMTKEIFVIDDLANRPHDCDILLDQNEYLDKETRYKGLVPDKCKLLLGYKHVLLREEFYEVKKTLRKRDGKVKNILVFYGGSDPTNETMKAVNALSGINLSGITVNVIVGGANVHKDKVADFCKKHEGFHYFCQVNNMAEMMAQADLALGAGGSATWERLFLELPSIVTVVADNQEKIAEDCQTLGLINYLGRAKEVSVERLKAEIERVLDFER